jgi:hypothetical protein
LRGSWTLEAERSESVTEVNLSSLAGFPVFLPGL